MLSLIIDMDVNWFDRSLAPRGNASRDALRRVKSVQGQSFHD